MSMGTARSIPSLLTCTQNVVPELHAQIFLECRLPRRMGADIGLR